MTNPTQSLLSRRILSSHEALSYNSMKPLTTDTKLTDRGPGMASDGLCSRPWAVSGNRALGAHTPLPPPRLHTASSRLGLASPDSANWANWHHPTITSASSHRCQHQPSPSSNPPLLGWVITGSHIENKNNSKTSALAGFERSQIYQFTFIGN